MKNFVKKQTIVARDSKAVETYMREVARFPLLSPTEEVELAKRSREGDMEARERLINCNLRFVLTVAHSYQGQGLALGDLISEGNLGLQHAVDQYDETKGFRFCSYAVWWIRQSIAQAIVQYSRTVRLPSNRQNFLNKINRTQSTLTQKLGRTPTETEIADYLDVETEDVSAVRAAAQMAMSIDQPSLGEDESPMSEKISSGAPSPDSGLMNESLSKDLDEALSCLTETQKEIITRLYGLGKRHECSIGELATTMDITQERVRQLHRNALAKIRNSHNADILRAYL